MRKLLILLGVLFLGGCQHVNLGYYEMVLPVPWGQDPISMVADVTGSVRDSEESDSESDED